MDRNKNRAFSYKLQIHACRIYIRMHGVSLGILHYYQKEKRAIKKSQNRLLHHSRIYIQSLSRHHHLTFISYSLSLFECKNLAYEIENICVCSSTRKIRTTKQAIVKAFVCSNQQVSQMESTAVLCALTVTTTLAKLTSILIPL